MDSELLRRVEALRRPLELAARDGFAGVRQSGGLGVALRVACDGVLAKASNDALAHWRDHLASWDQLEAEQREIVVAKGMRLLAKFPQLRNKSGVSRGPTIASLLATPAQPQPDARLGHEASGGRRSRKPTEPVASSDIVEDPLAAPTHSLPGIGPAFAERLAAKGLHSVEDLLWCLPRRYDDVRNAQSLATAAQLAEGARVTFVAKVTSSRMVFVRGRRWGEVRLVTCDQVPAVATVRFFNIWAGIDRRLPPGSVVTLAGVVRRRNSALEFANPDIVAVSAVSGVHERGSDDTSADAPPSIIARYPDIGGVPAGRLRTACQTACVRVAGIAADGVPEAVERAAGLPGLSETLLHLHTPAEDISPQEVAALNSNTSRWQRRLVFGELFTLGASVALKRRERRADAAVPCAHVAELDRILADALPFAVTAAQARSIRELGNDLARETPMNRLLQGDVGSGKTCVAFAAALQVARAGRQTAVMAPTELLAEQHATTWGVWADRAAIRIALLTASTPRAVRQSMMAMLANRQLDVVIGTHALLAEGVGFGALGLVVIDEQHRFGVAQRARLRDKGDGQGAPHLLVMTATPIPRTLTLTAYGDLDVSVLDELPPGRRPVTTSVVAGKRGETAAYKQIAACAARGEQAYIVCPKVDETGEAASADWKDATTVSQEVGRALPDVRVGLVHGRLDIAERDQVMQAFKRGDLDVLVATTVIEVGVDVPAATVMVVQNAERFGLAQLHQLRGRVGRGGSASHCILVTHGKLSDEAQRRLDALARTTDGFAIAEVDLELRGPGELCGPRQAGSPRLRFGDLSQNIELLLEARRYADAVLADDPQLQRPEHAPLRAALARKASGSVYGPEAG